MPPIPAPLRLRLDAAALTANWRALAVLSGGAACGAAVKADGYGLGARAVVARLAAAGCRDFFVATWGEAAQIADLFADGNGVSLSVLHGVRAEDMAAARSLPARPVLNTAQQVARWRDAGGGACDVMVDTGINRLGLSVADAMSGMLGGLAVNTLMSHLACADEDHPMNARQRDAFAGVAAAHPPARASLANSAGIFLGDGYRFGLTRPGLSLYGGIPCAAAAGVIAPVVRPEAQVIQRRRVEAGESAGYNATWTATAPSELAILNIGYADGYLRGFSGRGRVFAGGDTLPVVGRVSMDLLIVDVTTRPDVGEGDWLAVDYDLRAASAQSGLSQYELLTGMGARYDRVWG